ncbi:hypothetical protein VFPPC_17650 [Pochonia chlamydosporia 170]|uniref:Uncharacterized protein n=1 Tax=Pochonia chlamydosporia 170 TaxID=1380566 RepID=A0A219ASB0_METCM|nr:hypothetical protein VFPPC_17650 [Pochonia chlamydosporia 170]OWT43174.1 hypothetical protein VFPPC_17650 [Pochonia chlamydosporia 170]
MERQCRLARHHFPGCYASLLSHRDSLVAGFRVGRDDGTVWFHFFFNVDCCVRQRRRDLARNKQSLLRSVPKQERWSESGS